MRQEAETFNQCQRRLLGYLGWAHGQPLNENVKGLLGWAFGTKGETIDKEGRKFGKLLPGKSVFMLHPRIIANWIMFYVDSKVSKENLLAVRMEFSVVPIAERQAQVKK